MKTTVIDVRDLLSPLSALGVEKQLTKMAGVKQVDVNSVSGSTTVLYDEAVTSLNAIQSKISECGHHCGGELLPKHLCEQAHLPGDAHRRAESASLTAHAVHTEHRPDIAHTEPTKIADAEHAEMDHMGHGAGMDMQAMARDMRNRFFVALVFAIPVFLYASMGLEFLQLQPPFGIERNIFLFVLASGAIIYPGWPFYVAAFRAIRNGVANMAVLVLLSVGTGYFFSIGATFFFAGEQFYEASSVLLVFILLGHWLEMRARAGASDAIRALMDLAPPKATVLREGREIELPTSELIVGDTVIIRPGNKIPVDGEVIEGESQVDEFMLTGESMPVKKTLGASVIGATINKSGSFKYRATKVGADTALAQIVKLVQAAQNSKAPGQRLADRAAQWLVLAAIVIGLATFAVWFWWIGQPLLFALTLTITVFVIACPDALGLATPMAIMVGTGLGAMNGILFKNAAALEEATKLNVIIFDKTGTLTLGQPEVVDIATAAGTDVNAMLALAAAVEQGSEHPLAQAILKRAENVPTQSSSGFTNIEGMGAKAEVNGRTVLLGNRKLMDAEQVDMNNLIAKADEMQGAGRTVVHVAHGGKLLGLIAIADALRPTSKDAIQALQQRGVKVAMLTGDNRATAERIGKDAGYRHRARRRVAGAEGGEGQRITSARQQGRHGRRRHQRCARLDASRCGLRHRRGHRRGDGECRCGADEERPVRCGRRARAVPRHAAQDAPESLVGGGLQRDRLPVSRRCALSVYVESRDRRVGDVRQLGAGGGECADVEAHQVGGHSCFAAWSSKRFKITTKEFACGK